MENFNVITILTLLALISACQVEFEPCLTELDIELSQHQKPLTLKTPTIWSKRKIVVCFEDSAYGKERYDLYRRLIKEAVKESWVKALAEEHIRPKNRLDFIGWKRCDTFTNEDVFISNEDPGEKNVGLATIGERFFNSQLKLDFSHFDDALEKHSKTRVGSIGLGDELILVEEISKEEYLEKAKAKKMPREHSLMHWENAKRSVAEHESKKYDELFHIAVHEFGHILGFTHTQVRKDTPSECAERMRAEHPDTLTETDHPFMTGIALGAWDEGSIMNYCNPQRNGNLSELDIIGVRAVYNHPSVMAGESVSNDELCTQFGKGWEEYQN